MGKRSPYSYKQASKRKFSAHCHSISLLSNFHFYSCLNTRFFQYYGLEFDKHLPGGEKTNLTRVYFEFELMFWDIVALCIYFWPVKEFLFHSYSFSTFAFCMSLNRQGFILCNLRLACLKRSVELYSVQSMRLVSFLTDRLHWHSFPPCIIHSWICGDYTFRLFYLRLKLMRTAVDSLLNGCFIFAGAKGLEKLVVRYFKYIWPYFYKNDLFYRLFQKLLMLGQLVVSFPVIGFSTSGKRNLARLSLMVRLLTHVIYYCRFHG